MFVVTVPVEIDPGDAREAAARELADPAYQSAEPSIVERILRWFGRVLSAAGDLAPGGVVGLVVLVLLLVVVVAVVRLRVGGLARTVRGGRPAFETDRTRTARDYRQAAELAHARGDLDGAVRERLRAIVRELEHRRVLDDRSGRTVDEIAAAAGRRLPEHAGELRAAAALFDGVVYGGHHATEAGYHDLTTLDASLLVSR